MITLNSLQPCSRNASPVLVVVFVAECRAKLRLRVSGDGFRKKLPPPYITGSARHSKREMSLLIYRRQRRTVSPEISRLLNGLSSRCCLLQLMFTHHQTISTPLLCPNKEKTLLSKSPKLQSVTPTISRAPPFLSASSSSGYL